MSQPVHGSLKVPYQGRSVPLDQRSLGRQVLERRNYMPLDMRDILTEQPLSQDAVIQNILKNTDIDILLKTLGNAYTPRVVTVNTTPTLLIPPNRTPRGYILINPSQPVALTTSTTIFASALRAVGPHLSASFGVSNYLTLRLFQDVTAIGGAGATLIVNLQTQDPLTLNWATAQSDVFALPGNLAVAGQTNYASLGGEGVDIAARLQAVVAVNSVTFSISGVLKDGLAGTGSGLPQTVYLGPQDVNTTVGFPLFEGAREVFYLRENTPIFSVAQAATPIKIFQLQ